MKKIRLPFPKRRKGKQNIKFSIAFKATAIYTAMFGLMLAVAVGFMAWALTTHTSRNQKLERLTAFVAERLSRPDGRQFDYESFAQSNGVYIEIRDGKNGMTKVYGDRPTPNRRFNESARRVDVRGAEFLVKVVDEVNIGFARKITPAVFLAALAAMLLLVAIFGALLMRKMTQPVYDMMHTARSISASDLSKRIDTVHSHDELKELAETFNEMLGRIQKSYEQQNRFVSDASHELRTPLSVISGYANLLRRWGSRDEAVLNESIDKIVEESSNMQQLVERLLFLSRADKKTQPVKFEQFSASNLMRDILEETRLIDSGHTIKDEIEPDVFLMADPTLIKQAVRAVLENSMKYTPPGGTITIFCRQKPQQVELSVADTGIGISQKDLPHIFDRFYKADQSRTRTASGSSGLGLSIVKWIVERHDGKILVECPQGAGTTITFILPRKRKENKEQLPT